nr:hypothetical protein [Corynebacterium lactis]
MTSSQHRLQEALFFRASGEGAALRAAVSSVREGLFASLTLPRSVVVLAGDRRAAIAARAVVSLADDARAPIVVARKLPNYVGALDLVIVADEDPGSELADGLAAADRRGAMTVLLDPGEGPLRSAAGPATVVVPRPAMAEGASFNGYFGVIAAAITEAGVSAIAPAGVLEEVAEAVDTDLIACSPQRDVTVNPARQAAAWLSGRRMVCVGDRGIGEPVAELAALLLLEAGHVAHATDSAAVVRNLGILLAGNPSGVRDIFYDPYLDGEPEGSSVLPLGAIVIASPANADLLRDRFGETEWARVECPALDATARHPLVDVCVSAARVAAIAAFTSQA